MVGLRYECYLCLSLKPELKQQQQNEGNESKLSLMFNTKFCYPSITFSNVNFSYFAQVGPLTTLGLYIQA